MAFDRAPERASGPYSARWCPAKPCMLVENINIYSSVLCIYVTYIKFRESIFWVSISPFFSTFCFFAQIPIGNCGETSNKGPVSIELHHLFDQYTASRNSVPNGPRDQTILDLCRGKWCKRKELHISFHPITLICGIKYEKYYTSNIFKCKWWIYIWRNSIILQDKIPLYSVPSPVIHCLRLMGTSYSPMKSPSLPPGLVARMAMTIIVKQTSACCCDVLQPPTPGLSITFTHLNCWSESNLSFWPADLPPCSTFPSEIRIVRPFLRDNGG